MKTTMNTVFQTAMENAVLVRIHGPDPKRRKMRMHAFYHTEYGDTTLSSSGLLVSSNTLSKEDMEKFYASHDRKNVSADFGDCALVITCASTVEPFLSPKVQSGGGKVPASPKLIAGAELDVLIKEPGKAEEEADGCRTYWSPAQFVALIDVPEAGEALKTLLDSHNGNIESSWEVGWALAKVESNRQLHGFNAQKLPNESEIPRYGEDNSKETTFGLIQSSSLAMAATRVALLTVHLQHKKIGNHIVLAKPSKRGDFLLHVGSPFGALSPSHFFNSISVGIVSNCWPPVSGPMSLLMADVRCFPGMEGGPVFNKNGELVGILICPLRQRGSGAEIQLVIPSLALASALDTIGILLLGTPRLKDNAASRMHKGGAYSPVREEWQTAFPSFEPQGIAQFPGIGGSVQSAVQRAVSSVVLVTVGDGAWASGVILNKGGLILTNAHLLEPWRFGKGKFSQLTEDCTLTEYPLHSTAPHEQLIERTFSADDQLHYHKRFSDPVKEAQKEILSQQTVDGLLSVESSKPERPDESSTFSDLTYAPPAKLNRYDRIRVRMDQCFPNLWFDAQAVYISQGPLDIALLQLTTIPENLLPIIPERASPPIGSLAVVLGHGLFGPRADLSSSVTAGVVSKVVKVDADNFSTKVPAMLETTAAVHPGGSGGAVVNEQGHLIGLVTSIARHSGGMVIPHLNFSIPCAVMESIFDCAAREKTDWFSFQQMEKQNDALSAVWALVPATPPRPSPKMKTYVGSPLSQDFKESSESKIPKGSKFAKFIADRGAKLDVKHTGTIKEKWVIEDQQKLGRSGRLVIQSRL